MTPRPSLWPDEAHAASPWHAASSHAPPPMPDTYEEMRLLRRSVTVMAGVYRELAVPTGGFNDGSSPLDWAPRDLSCPDVTLGTILDLLRGAVGR